MSVVRRALVYGANGALGRALVQSLCKVEGQWEVVGCDVSLLSHAHHNIHVVRGGMNLQAEEVRQGLSRAIGTNCLDAIFCVSGGFAMGAPCDDHFLNVADTMITSSVSPSLVSTRLSAQFLKPNGLLTLPGAHIVNDPNPSSSLCGYGGSKAFVHYLTKAAAHPDSGIPAGSKVIAIAPVFIDTPTNRAAMPQHDTSSWTPLTSIADKLVEWALDPHHLTNGDIVSINTKNNVTSFVSEKGTPV